MCSAPTCAGPAGPWPTTRVSNARPGLRDLLALFDALGIERANLVSHDMGVLTAMQLTYDHPERVRTAVKLAVPPGFMRFSPKTLPGFRHLPPFVWHRPGRLTARSLL